VVAVLWGAVQRFHGMTRPPGQDVGVYGLIARNYLKYGFPDAGLAQIVSPGPVRPAGERVYYVTHPPLATLLGSIGIAALGPTTFALRLPHLLADVIAVVALAWLAARLFGPAAGAWCAIAAAAMPAVGTYSLSMAGPIGAPLVMAVGLAALGYARYCDTGARRYYAGLLLALVLACLGDWPAYALPFLIAAHAVVYRSRARWRHVLIPAGIAVLLAGAFVAYALRIPVRQHIYGGLYFAFSGWSEVARATSLAVSYSLPQWLRGVGRSFVVQLTPFAALAALWALLLVPRAVFRRTVQPAQHVLLLWAWPVPYMVVFHRIFYVHPHYQILFIPAVVVTLGALGARIYDGSAARRGPWRGVLAVAGFAVLILWSHHFTVAWEEPRARLRRRTVRSAQDIKAYTAPDEASAFTDHYAMQMRFLADRVVHEQIHSLDQLAEARATAYPPTTVFVPLAYPFAPAGLGHELSASFPARAGEATLAFSLDEESRPPEPAVHRLEDVALEDGITIEHLEFAAFATVEGETFLYFAPAVSPLPPQGPGDVLEWRYQIVGPGGKPRQTGTVPASAEASYFLPVPHDWALTTGRMELVLSHVTTDAAEVSSLTRLGRFALRLATLSHCGRHEQRQRSFTTHDGSPIVLSAPRGAP
jgi:hypothetical protein